MGLSAEDARRPPEVPAKYRHEDVRPRRSPEEAPKRQGSLPLIEKLMAFVQTAQPAKNRCASCGQATRNLGGLCEECVEKRLAGQSSDDRSSESPLRSGAMVNTLPRIPTLVYLATVAILCLYVPWQGVVIPGRGVIGGVMDQGYAFLWDPPSRVAVVDFARVVLTVVALTAAFGFVAILARSWKERR